MLLEVTGEDIAALSDEDLRTLVGLLCESELRVRSLPTSAATWGGNQDAKDGGVDVRVALDAGAQIHGHIPKASTGYQVKKSPMARAAILKEMKPEGAVRPSILELASASGAYVIVSSGENVSDMALKNRREAMAEAMAGVPEAANLKLDFYDRSRISTWVRDHPTLVAWIRSRVGRPMTGWRPYGSWSGLPDGADPVYLTDDTGRVRTGRGGNVLTARQGLEGARDVLRTPGRVVRLVGLSGTGKTRFAEALFDAAIGRGSLDSSVALYTDVAEGPQPQPVHLVTQLIEARATAILVVDNCPPDLHRQLADVVRSAGTTVSVITIEYDIQDGQPEGTDVFALGVSSNSLIETLLSKRFLQLSQVDARRIADFAGGNARIALALAGTVKENDAVAELSDEHLFGRLFQQRQEPDASILLVARVCSLVYSFDGENVTGDEAELAILGGLIARSANDLFRGLAELRRRDLLQARGPWRAILPHAIANRLAVAALQDIPAATLNDAFQAKPPYRLLQSLSRRLGYLSDRSEARAIVDGWLGHGGILSDVSTLNELGCTMFKNIAPVAPEGALAALENAIGRALDEEMQRYARFVPLLRSLAYDPALFRRAALLLVRLAPHTREGKDHSEAQKALGSLFYIMLSGTHAPLELRLAFTSELLGAADAIEYVLGAEVLKAMLQTAHFSSHYEYEFGARSRDYGFQPKTGDEVRRWFIEVLALAEAFALSGNAVAAHVRTAVAEEFRGLWNNSGAADDLERLARAIGDKGFWREGWIAVRETLCYDGKGLQPEMAARLSALEKALAPSDLFARVRGVVIGASSGRLEFDDFHDVENGDYEAAARRTAEIVGALGIAVAGDEQAFNELLPELISGQYNNKIQLFGRSLAMASKAPREMWNSIVARIAAINDPSIALLGGFLGGLHEREPDLACELLDEALVHDTLAEWFPFLQGYVALDEAAALRLVRAVDLRRAPLWRFRVLSSGRICDPLTPADFKRLVLAIGARREGLSVAVHILSMRLHSDHIDKRVPAPEIAEAGRELLGLYDFRRRDDGPDRDDYDLAKIILASLAEESGRTVARRMCSELLAAVKSYEISTHDHDEMMTALFKVHPTDILDELFGGDQDSQRSAVYLLNHFIFFRQNPMSAVEDGVIIRWCDVNPVVRYPLVAAVALVFRRPSEQSPYEWTSLASQLLIKAPNPDAVFQELVHRLRPRSWGGSLAEKLEERSKLLYQLQPGDVARIAVSVEKAKREMAESIESERRRESSEEPRHAGSFE